MNMNDFLILGYYLTQYSYSLFLVMILLRAN